MKCYFHNNNEAVGICKNCGVAVCKMCSTLKSEKLLCPTCLKSNQEKAIILNGKSIIDLDSKINKLIDNFNFYVETGLDDLKNKWTKGIKDHGKVIRQIRKENEISKLLVRDSFLDDVYNVLRSFGMDSRSAKIKNLQEFKYNILKNKDKIIFLSQYELEKLSTKDFESLKEPILQLFKSMRIMKSHARLVGFSKTMAHLVPDLIPPIDRQKIHLFFYGHTNLPHGVDAEADRFWAILSYFYKICKEVKISKNNWKLEGFNSSVPKIIDNAIWGFMSLNKNKSSFKSKNNFSITNLNRKQKSYEKITTIKKMHNIIKNLGSNFSKKDIMESVLRQYPDTHLPTLRCNIYMSTVNNPIRVNWPINKRQRITDHNYDYDLFFEREDGFLERYEPKNHGIWEIININGSFQVKKKI